MNLVFIELKYYINKKKNLLKEISQKVPVKPINLLKNL